MNVKSKINFCKDLAICALKGGPKYYAWLGFLGFFVMLWAYGWYHQATKGMIVTGLTDQVTWGIYLANFVFLVGVAAAAVTVVFPAYIYKHKQLKEIVVLGECLAIAAVVMCLLFVLAHMGRPDRAWHMIPSWAPIPYFHGIFNWPNSMLTWDVMVLNAYLVLNLICAFYYLYKKYAGREINKRFYMPFVYVTMVWALSIHTVTAFLINTMPARPMWFHSVMPIKFIITAFAAGPCLIIVAFLVIRKNTTLKIADEAINLLSQIITWCLGIALFLALSEIVTELYPSTEHSFSLKYLMFGMHGLTKLVPWFWVSLLSMITAFILFLIPSIRKNHNILPYICILAFAGIWIEKGMGLLLPGFIPSPIGEFTEYTPSWIEIFISLGSWAIGLGVFTILLKFSVGILTGEIRYNGDDGAGGPAAVPVVGNAAATAPKDAASTGPKPWDKGKWGGGGKKE
ncbi:MAG: NrfD/PsrC family molybdoenzyme membrane anchor subunit [Thermodesulfobacteriota bacterium]